MTAWDPRYSLLWVKAITLEKSQRGYSLWPDCIITTLFNKFQKQGLLVILIVLSSRWEIVPSVLGWNTVYVYCYVTWLSRRLLYNFRRPPQFVVDGGYNIIADTDMLPLVTNISFIIINKGGGQFSQFYEKQKNLVTIYMSILMNICCHRKKLGLKAVSLLWSEAIT